MLINSRFQLTCIALASCILLYFFFNNSIANTTKCNRIPASEKHLYSFRDLNNQEISNATLSQVLILTPFKQSVQFIDRYFDNIIKLTYPHHLISLGFLVSDSTDGTIERLQERSQLDSHRFHSIHILKKDFQYDLATNEDRHAFEVQVQRRSIMAKSRNTLLSSALTQDHDWVLWLDGDVVDYPETLLEELIGMNKDVLAPNCFWHSYNEEGGYDKNNWQETPESLEFQKTLAADQVLVEGYPELITHRKLMIDMRHEDGQTDLFYTVPLDAVGGTCTLVRAEVHRAGAIFPPFVFQHQVETEGLAKMAKALGYEVWGLPNYLVYHYI
ncbi:Anp1-domain-containing protein [Cokeromyces recurvatus]|uniref:Anp1-domain-containing protein n=1 Tax=Cokeromyces recurvatus TaxID=90255 RepID=UPI00221EAE2E|nr:Anp1-domain-containing protein [Cokeromyces recurvatus]KAI7898402.1 Anp1-domain-containing protein [Cokeromyces recurvatus]